MKRKYTIGINGSDQRYPFDGDKPNFSQKYVRVNYDHLTQDQYVQFSRRLNILLNIKNDNIIQILEVQQIKSSSMILTYQYIAQGLKQSNRINQGNQSHAIKQKCINLYLELMEHNIKLSFNIDSIGFDEHGIIKAYIPLNFQILQTKYKEKYKTKIQNQIQKSFKQHFPSLYSSVNLPSNFDNKSQKSLELSLKMAKIQQRLKKRHKNRNNYSPSNSIESLKSKSKSKQSKKSNNSLINSSSNYLLPYDKYSGKIHKSSFGEYTTTSHKLNQLKLNQQESSEQNLKTRLQNAIQKSKEAFKVYQKYSKHKI